MKLAFSSILSVLLLARTTSATPINFGADHDPSYMINRLRFHVGEQNIYKKQTLVIKEVMGVGPDSIVGKAEFEGKDIILKCSELTKAISAFVEMEEKTFKKVENGRKDPKKNEGSEHVAVFKKAFYIPVNTGTSISGRSSSVTSGSSFSSVRAGSPLTKQVSNLPPKGRCFMIDYIPGTTLKKYINLIAKDKAKTTKLTLLMFDVLKGIKFLTRIGVIHGDIQPNNIMVSGYAGGRLKATLIDLDCSICFRSNMKKDAPLISSSTLGMQSFMPFEVIVERNHDLFKTTIWQVGAVFYYALFGLTPYEAVARAYGLDHTNIDEFIMDNVLYYLDDDSDSGSFEGVMLGKGLKKSALGSTSSNRGKKPVKAATPIEYEKEPFEVPIPTKNEVIHAAAKPLYNLIKPMLAIKPSRRPTVDEFLMQNSVIAIEMARLSIQ